MADEVLNQIISTTIDRPSVVDILTPNTEDVSFILLKKKSNK